ncbi:MAG: hypothetical protein CXZ00_06580 [Acidobacteria bacterium]|nr:MAG: hypothetical protein CXZ00_06580 [Acidobacteriota bacterium]
MTRQKVFAGFLLFFLLPAVGFAAQAQSRSDKIQSIELQYLAATTPAQRKQFVNELKSLNILSEDAAALNRAVSAMLPAADSVEEAEELLRIGAANPVGRMESASNLSSDTDFLVNAQRAALAAHRAIGEVEALADIRIDHLRKDSLGRDGLVSAHVQQIWRINSVHGAKIFSLRSVMYSSMAETLYMVHARVLKNDGRELEAKISADLPVLERSTSMYFDSRTRDLYFPQLDPGDLVEIEYHLLPASDLNPWAGYYARMDLFRDSFPTRLRRRVVVAPSTMKLFAVEHRLRPAVVRQRNGETTRIWEARDIDAQAFEALTPGASASSPYLHISTIGSIEEFGRWYSSLLEPGLQLTENLRAIANKILESDLTTWGKVQAVYETVQRSTKYIAFEFGVHSYQPYAVAKVDRRGFGDCKDKAAMIVALLRAVGVPAEFAMVRTRSAGEVVPEAYSVQLFNHAVAYVPALDLYLDGTADYAALGELPPDDQGGQAMTVDARGNATRRTITFASPEANRVSREIHAHLAPDGRVEFQSRTKYEGYFAAEQRRTLESNDLAGSYRATLAQFYPTVKIAHAVAEGTARASREVELKIDGSIDVVHGGREITLRSSLNAAGLTNKYAPERLRKNPVLVPVIPSEHEVFDYDLPEGAEVALPPDTKLETAFGKIEVTYSRQASKLRVETYRELAPLTVAASDYAAFRAFCNAADKALQREVKVVLP